MHRTQRLLATAVACLALGLTAGFAGAGPGFEPVAHRAGADVSAPSPAPAGGLDAPEVQVLLSSIDMTVSLIDAYGKCRDEARPHEACIRMIRATLAEAREIIQR